MKPFFSSAPRVILLLSTAVKASRDNLAGILRYVKLHTPWNVQIVEKVDTEQIVKNFRAWNADGMIVGLMPEKTGIGNLKIPTVTMDGNPGHFAKHFKGAVHITCDSQAIAYAGADYLVGKGFRSFAYVFSGQGEDWSTQRAEFFSQRLMQKGFNCHILPSENRIDNRSGKDWMQNQTTLTQWLRSLPTKTAIFVSNDQKAREILSLCQLANIHVPADLAILGCDNDEMLCENTTPPLSSIEPDFQACGYQAAELLEQLMFKSQNVPYHNFYGMRQIAERESTRFCSVKLDSRVSAGLNFIRLNATRKIGVCDVSDHMQVSRRMAELIFKKNLASSIGHEIQHARIEKLKHLLTDSPQSITTICGLCGYNSESQAKLVFKNNTGTSMSQFRKAEREKYRAQPKRALPDTKPNPTDPIKGRPSGS